MKNLYIWCLARRLKYKLSSEQVKQIQYCNFSISLKAKSTSELNFPYIQHANIIGLYGTLVDELYKKVFYNKLHWLLIVKLIKEGKM